MPISHGSTSKVSFQIPRMKCREASRVRTRGHISFSTSSSSVKQNKAHIFILIRKDLKCKYVCQNTPCQHDYLYTVSATLKNYIQTSQTCQEPPFHFYPLN